jgi:hypothetical protein
VAGLSGDAVIPGVEIQQAIDAQNRVHVAVIVRDLQHDYVWPFIPGAQCGDTVEITNFSSRIFVARAVDGETIAIVSSAPGFQPSAKLKFDGARWRVQPTKISLN